MNSFTRRTPKCPCPPWHILVLMVWALVSPLRSEAADGPEPASLGATVVVLYNSDLKESQDVAEHYLKRRKVPRENVIGLALPRTDSMNRAEYTSRLEEPLVRELVSRGLMTLREEIRPATENAPGKVMRVLTGATVRHIVLCHGVPIRVSEDGGLREPESSVFPELLRRNEASVDAELTVLPLALAGHPKTGPVGNVWYGATNAAALHPTNGVFVVGRLDGANPELSKALVDRALEAEQNGLLGRGYFDIRSIADGSYVNGDLWISNAWMAVSHYGFDTYLDTRPETLPAGFPLSHVAFYAGWYDVNVSGPFAADKVEFMPGAIAYHLHSFSGANLRTTGQNWVGPLVARGVTATMGTISEPYLDGTPDIGLCYGRLLYSAFSWGEAALVSQRMLSWQLTVVGDPLYRPFAVNPLERLKELAARNQGRLDWPLIQLYNRKLEATKDRTAVITELQNERRLRFSPVLQEKLADLLRLEGQEAAAAEWYRKALGWMVSPMQRRRLLWSGGEAAQAAGKPADAYDFYVEIARSEPPLPQPTVLFERLESLARSLGKGKDAESWEKRLEEVRSGKP